MCEKGAITPEVSCAAGLHYHSIPSVLYQAQYNVMSDHLCKLCVVEVRDVVLLCLFCCNIYFSLINIS